jgi:hypothetical protein
LEDTDIPGVSGHSHKPGADLRYWQALHDGMSYNLSGIFVMAFRNGITKVLQRELGDPDSVVDVRTRKPQTL